MNRDIDKKSMQERLQHLVTLISGQRFLQRQGLGNEVPFFICPYRPEEAVAMETLQRQLINQLELRGIRVLPINLYDLSVQILKERGIWDRILEMESSVSKDQLKELLQGVLDPETNLVPAIAATMASSEFHVMFLSGVGEVFPYIRSHNVLNNLQSTAKDKPTVMFFPGAYTHSLESGASLDLFGRLHDDKYYRAFNIFHCEP
jgi:hypothetical protein